jgi:hypothetical protein
MRKRDPRLRKRIDETRIGRAWVDHPQHQENIIQQLSELRDSLPDEPSDSEATAA